MKTLLTILLLIPVLGFGQFPDSINLYGIALDTVSLTKEKIDTMHVEILYIDGEGILRHNPNAIIVTHGIFSPYVWGDGWIEIYNRNYYALVDDEYLEVIKEYIYDVKQMYRGKMMWQ